MRDHKILYFSVDKGRLDKFYNEYKVDRDCHLIRWEWSQKPEIYYLPDLIADQKDLDCLYVIIDYLPLFDNIDVQTQESVLQLDAYADIIRRTILQYPEVDFLFDQSNIDTTKLPSGVEFLLDFNQKYVKQVVAGLHIYKSEDHVPLPIHKLDYDNLFDGSSLRGAVRSVHYEKLNVSTHNFEQLQNSRHNNLAWVVDDEPRQSRFNSYALYASGYRVMPVHTARMLFSLSQSKEKDLTPKLILRDFDLQFSDLSKNKDYQEFNNSFCFIDVLTLNSDSFSWEQSKEINPVAGFKKMIDYVRGYYHDKDKTRHMWVLSEEKETVCFWAKKDVPTYVITNGMSGLKIIGSGEYEKMKKVGKDNDHVEVHGVKKPVSGLYHVFFTHIKDKDGKNNIRNCFEGTRYSEKNKSYYIDKTRNEHDHGVPADVYGIAHEMISRANHYYKGHHFVKAAILSQETIELLNGLHYQMMIKAYEVKCKAENAIAMDVVGADEKQLVLDAILRIKMVRQDVRRMVYPMYRDETELDRQLDRRKKEHQILDHIFSECRATCRKNEFFDVESVFIREMAHIDHHYIGLSAFVRYFKHLFEIRKRKIEEQKRLKDENKQQ